MNNRRTIARNNKAIPPPPGPEEGHDAVIAYFDRYSTEQLEEAGHLQEPSAAEVAELVASAAYESLCAHGLHAKLTRKAYAQISRLAAEENVPVEKLVARWINQRLQEECRRATDRQDP
jgi:hypothetical protein